MLQQNIKTRDISAIGLCIWLVMLGHILEHIASPATNIMGWCVYSFHSALLVMCAGKTLRFSPWWSLGLYALSLVTPTWWIGAPALYMLTIPLLQKVPHGKRWIVLVCSIIAGLLSGFCPDPHGIAATLHLTRAVTFFPFFVIGVYQCTERPCKLRHVIQILSAIADHIRHYHVWYLCIPRPVCANGCAVDKAPHCCITGTHSHSIVNNCGMDCNFVVSSSTTQ